MHQVEACFNDGVDVLHDLAISLPSCDSVTLDDVDAIEALRGTDRPAACEAIEDKCSR